MVSTTLISRIVDTLSTIANPLEPQLKPGHPPAFNDTTISHVSHSLRPLPFEPEPPEDEPWVWPSEVVRMPYSQISPLCLTEHDPPYGKAAKEDERCVRLSESAFHT